MKVRKKENFSVNMQKAVTINIFYKNNYKYYVKIIKNTNILIITKEDTKSELFEVEIFEIM